jgi:hypothetical protein
MKLVEVWHQLGEPVLRSGRKVGMTCHFFRHRVTADGIPDLTRQLHCALIPQRCPPAPLGGLVAR